MLFPYSSNQEKNPVILLGQLIHEINMHHQEMCNILAAVPTYCSEQDYDSVIVNANSYRMKAKAVNKQTNIKYRTIVKTITDLRKRLSYAENEIANQMRNRPASTSSPTSDPGTPSNVNLGVTQEDLEAISQDMEADMEAEQLPLAAALDVVDSQKEPLFDSTPPQKKQRKDQ